MEFIAKLAKETYDFNKDKETHLLIELEAPKVKLSEKRSPICVIPVLDVSGSMHGSKLDYLKKACRKLIDHLAPGDFAGIVAYDSYVHEVAPVREVTQEQKEILKKEVAKLRAGSATNLSGGLLKALEWINNTDLPDNTILRVILFTDGQANTGLRGKNLIKMVSKQKNRATISAFGFGNDCDQEILADVSSKGEGNYAFVDSADAALSAFGKELGGLITTYAQDIKIKISPDKNNEIIEILNDEDVSEDGKTAVIRLRDILGEEKKWIVAKVKLSQVDKPFPRKVNAFQIQTEFVDRDGKTQKLNKHSIKVKFCKAGGEKSEENCDVVLHRDRLLAAKAQEMAEIHVKNGNYSMAQNVLQECAYNVSDSNVKGVLGDITANYCNASNYAGSRGLSNSVKTALRGKRMSYASGASTRLCREIGGVQSSTAIDEMEAEFVAEDSETIVDYGSGENKISIHTSPDSDELTAYIPASDAGSITVTTSADSNVFIPTTTTPGHKSLPKEEEKKSTTKKRTKRDW